MYTIDEIKTLRDTIEQMAKVHQLQILDICKRHDVQYTENVNGIFINMTLLTNKTFIAIDEYIKYISLQQLQLDNVEATKKKYQEEFYNKEASTY
tara:strand:- start:192 stop:476 length:285 start_codon:yes stop_codon:yes gene_type:complete